MIKTTPEKIKQIAIGFQQAGKKWHFHILTPQCLLNDTGQFAFVLENTTDNINYISITDKPEMELGKQLVQYLHGDDITQKNESTEEISQKAKKILKRAKDLNESGKHWHHHMLFPDCIYNNHKGEWAVIFEDPETKEILEIISPTEPKADLHHIEHLYYKQDNLK